MAHSGQASNGSTADELARSANHGRQLAALLDPDTRMPSISQLLLRTDITVIAVPTTLDGCNMSGDAVMPEQARVVERPFTPEERSAMAGCLWYTRSTWRHHLGRLPQ